MVLGEGVPNEIYRARQAILLFREIADNLDPIKENGFEDLFGTIQQQ